MQASIRGCSAVAMFIGGLVAITGCGSDAEADPADESDASRSEIHTYHPGFSDMSHEERVEWVEGLEQYTPGLADRVWEPEYFLDEEFIYDSLCVSRPHQRAAWDTWIYDDYDSNTGEYINLGGIETEWRLRQEIILRVSYASECPEHYEALDRWLKDNSIVTTFTPVED